MKIPRTAPAYNSTFAYSVYGTFDRNRPSHFLDIVLWPIFHFSRWRPSAILDLFYACWDHPRRVLGGLCDCAKFGCNRRSNFDTMQILIFCTSSLKMPIHAAKIGVLRDFTPKMGSSMNETPKRHILGRKHVVWEYYLDDVFVEQQPRMFNGRQRWILGQITAAPPGEWTALQTRRQRADRCFPSPTAFIFTD